MTSGFYEEYKRHHICVRCGKKDARTLIGRILCYECAQEASEKKKNPEYRKRHTEAEKQRAERFREQGLCTRCGKRKPAEGFARCEYCRAAQRRVAERHRRKRGQRDPYIEAAVGNCWRCFKPVAPGYKLCPECLEVARRCQRELTEEQRKERNARKEENNPNTSAD